MSTREVLAAVFVFFCAAAAAVTFFVFNRHTVPVGRRAAKRVRGLNWLSTLDEGTHFVFPLLTHVLRDSAGLPASLPSEEDKGRIELGPILFDYGVHKVEVVLDVDYWISGDPNDYLKHDFDAERPPRVMAEQMAEASLRDFELPPTIPKSEIYHRIVRSTTRRRR